MVSVRFQVRNVEEVRLGLAQLEGDLAERIRLETARSAFDIEGDGKRGVNVNFARLRTAIRVKLTNDGLTADVGVFEGTKIRGQLINYGRFVHDGTRGAPRKMPPLAPLKLWAARKLGDESAAYAVALKIQREGTKPNPFLKRSFDTHAPTYRRRVEAAIRAATRQ